MIEMVRAEHLQNITVQVEREVAKSQNVALTLLRDSSSWLDLITLKPALFTVECHQHNLLKVRDVCAEVRELRMP
jgi:hypothetical protein